MAKFKNTLDEDKLVALQNKEFPHAPNWITVEAGKIVDVPESVGEKYNFLEAVEVKAVKSKVNKKKVETKKVSRYKSKKKSKKKK